MYSRFSIVFGGAIYSIVSLFVPIATYAQESGPVLEEIIVTAQRRAQSLQDVPLSITTFSGEQILNQGFKELEDLGRFEPQVQIAGGSMANNVFIRGVGTIQFATLFEQSVPIFIDNVHMSRASMVKTAFLDVERVEILKGPQPVYFGQNAVAGAIRIESAKPTPQWEGYVNAEAGNFNNRKIEGAVSGPLTDTLAFRVAGKWDGQDGYLQDIIHPNNKNGWFDARGGRIMLTWTPTNNFSATAKFETSSQNRDPAPSVTCEVGPFNQRVDRRQPPSSADLTDEGDESSVFIPFPRGSETIVQFAPLDKDPTCSKSNKSTGSRAAFFEPPIHLRTFVTSTGILDIRQANNAMTREGFATMTPIHADKFVSDGIADRHDKSRIYFSYLDLNYRFDNGIEVDWLSSFSDHQRTYLEDNRNSPFLIRFQNRLELNKSYSSELRITSPNNGYDFGDINIEYMAGVYWQKEDYDYGFNTTHADGAWGIRSARAFQDTTWKSVFGTMTFNFLDGKASLDLGGRYAEISKDASMDGIPATWVFDVTPCASGPLDHLGGGDTDPNNCAAIDSNAIQLSPADVVITSNVAETGRTVDMANLWTTQFRFPFGRDIPATWRGARAHPVGHTRIGYYPGPSVSDSVKDTSFDPQVTVRYRATPNMSFYVRWVKAFKATGFDGGVAFPPPQDEFRFDPEKAEAYEAGVKGTLWNGRARYDVTFFNHETIDLQLETPNPVQTSQNVAINAAGQRARGVEFGAQAALSERLTAGFTGQVMESIMTDYQEGGCTAIEFDVADTGPCRNLAEAIALGDADLEGTIDRTGTKTAFAPGWKVVLNSEYTLPVWETYNVTFAANGYYSDSYHRDPRGFSQTVKFDTHGDLNLRVMFGDQEGKWQIGAYARSLLEGRRAKYFVENDVDPSALRRIGRSRDAHTQYGLNYRYNFR